MATARLQRRPPLPHHCHPAMRSQLHAPWLLPAQPPATPSIPRPRPPTSGAPQLPHADTRCLHSLKPLSSTHSDLGTLDPPPTSSDPGEEAMDLRGGGRSEPPSPSFMAFMLLPCHRATIAPLQPPHHRAVTARMSSSSTMVLTASPVRHYPSPPALDLGAPQVGE
jgi:hypothetical protein